MNVVVKFVYKLCYKFEALFAIFSVVLTLKRDTSTIDYYTEPLEACA